MPSLSMCGPKIWARKTSFPAPFSTCRVSTCRAHTPVHPESPICFGATNGLSTLAKHELDKAEKWCRFGPSRSTHAATCMQTRAAGYSCTRSRRICAFFFSCTSARATLLADVWTRRGTPRWRCRGCERARAPEMRSREAVLIAVLYG